MNLQNKFLNMKKQKDNLNKDRGIQITQVQKEALDRPEHPSHQVVEVEIQEDEILTIHFSIGVHPETHQEGRRQVVEEELEAVEVIPVRVIQVVPTTMRTTQVSMLRYPEPQEEIHSSMPRDVHQVLTTPDVQISTLTESMTKFR